MDVYFATENDQLIPPGDSYGCVARPGGVSPIA
jgi:hypothetical protein